MTNLLMGSMLKPDFHVAKALTRLQLPPKLSKKLKEHVTKR
jgi:hypothetical protein